MEPSQAKEIEVHLAEYQALRSEISLSNQRIDRIIGFYLMAVFAILTYFLRPDSGLDLPKYLNEIHSDNVLTGVLLIFPILNSVLLIRLATFILSILAMAKYLLNTVSARLSILLGTPVLSWDKSSIVDAKKPWSAVGSLGQSLFFLLSEALSVVILVNTSYVFNRNVFICLLYVGGCFSVFLSFLAMAAVLYVSLNFHKPSSSNPQILSASSFTLKPKKAVDSSSEDSEFFWSLIVGSSATGVLYLSIFLPLTYFAARNMGVSITDLLFYTNVDLPSDFYSFTSPIVPLWSNSFSQAKHLIYPFGVFYGTVSLLLGFIILFFKRNGLANLVVLGNGLFGGYYLTVHLSKYLFRIPELNMGAKLMYFRFGYVLLAYYIFEGLKNLMDTNLPSRAKYQLFFDGMFLLACTLILMKEFPHSTVSVLTGPLFLISFFAATAVAEQTVGRCLFALETLAQHDFTDRSSKPSIKELLALSWKSFLSYKWQNLDFSFPVHGICSTFRERSLALTFSLIWFAIAAIFPVFATIIYQIVLKGHF